MGKLNGISHSEKLTLMLDGELDPKEEQSLLEEIDNNPELQEEMDQLISIREALLKDTEAFTPPAAVTSSVFSSIGYMAPATAGGTAATTSLLTPFVQSVVMPVVTALLISGGTLIFTNSDLTGIFSGDSSSLVSSADSGSTDNTLSDVASEDLTIENSENNYPSTTSRTVVSNSSDTEKTKENFTNSDSNQSASNSSTFASEKRNSITSENVGSFSDNQESEQISEDRSINPKSQENLAGTNSAYLSNSNVLIDESGIFFSNALNTEFTANNRSVFTQGDSYSTSSYQYSDIRKIKNSLSAFSTADGRQIGVEIIPIKLTDDIGIGFSFSSVSDLTDNNTELTNSEFLIGPYIQYSLNGFSYGINEDFTWVPATVSAGVGASTNLAVWNASLQTSVEYSNFNLGVGYRYNQILSEFGSYELSAHTPLPSNMFISFGWQF